MLFQYIWRVQFEKKCQTPAATADMINDGFLGLSVIALAMVIWVAYILIKDPKGTVRGILFKTTK